MSRKRAIKRMLLTLMWVVVAAGMYVVVAAAIRIQDGTACSGYNIQIESLEKGNTFTSVKNIEALIKKAAKGDIKGQKLSSLDLVQMEDLLEQSPWVLNAELFIDNLNALQIKIVERIPLARIFTTNHESFYFDGLGRIIPLSDDVTMNVPVFTGYVNKKIMNASDSILLQNIIATANFISKDSFWNAQVSEINITSSGKNAWEMAMIPVIGNHKVILGDGSDIASKFHRLYLFYSQVLKNIGFDKYKTIDVEYANQVVAAKGDFTKVDSIALRKTIAELLEQNRDLNSQIEEAATVPVGERYKLETANAKNDDSLIKAELPDLEPQVAVAPPVVEKKVEVKTPVTKVDKKPLEVVKKETTKVVSKTTAAPKTVVKHNSTPPVKPTKVAAAKTNTSPKHTAVKKEEKKATNAKPVNVLTKKTENKKPVQSNTTHTQAKKETSNTATKNVLSKPSTEKKIEKKVDNKDKNQPNKKVTKKP